MLESLWDREQIQDLIRVPPERSNHPRVNTRREETRDPPITCAGRAYGRRFYIGRNRMSSSSPTGGDAC